MNQSSIDYGSLALAGSTPAQSHSSEKTIRWRFADTTWLILAAALALTIWAYHGGLINLVHRWEVEEEYNHGYFLPFMTLVFLWQLAPVFSKQMFRPTWFGLAVAVLALMLLVVGELSAIYLLIHYSFILVLFALSLALVGWAGTRMTFAPIGILVFAIPIPYFLEATITAKLQLLSSKLGVDLIRFCKIPVFREGNLIDLGVFKLEVIEACSGLTYLYPLLGFGAICAYMYKTDPWKRVVVILSTIPIAVLLNSFRIGMIGFLVKYFGGDQAKGFLHDFEGFAVFMVCVGLLFIEIWALTFVGANRIPFNGVFGLKFEAMAGSEQDDIRTRPLSGPLLACLGMIAVTALSISAIETRNEILPARTTFSLFPTSLGAWRGTPSVLESEVLKTLELTDYLLMDFQDDRGQLVNFYVAYYESQRKGTSPHSPTVCMPGGGWQIVDMTRRTFAARPGDAPFEFNRVLIRKGNVSQLVYYWFLERGRVVADEYQAKWYLFRDALLENRTDGALVRVTTPVFAGESVESADRRIANLLVTALPILPDYVPN
ncbi:MAG: VPLPA-CTERM-specific exosortase XrtD [Methylomonas sp.]|nr:VPLPA-CTERM-specific exosortase XrtD [Methylomonas sp.]